MQREELRKEIAELAGDDKYKEVQGVLWATISGWVVIVSAIYVLHLGQEFHFIFHVQRVLEKENS